MTTRGMNMREMSNRRYKGCAPRSKRAESNPGGRENEPPPDDEDDGGLDIASDDVLEDRGDGVRVLSRARRQSDESGRDACPDEPPPGWCETD